MEFTSSELRVLKNAFIASDLDGDGVINKADLKLSSGLLDEQDVDDLMKAMKEAAGSTNGKDEVTFDEFTKGVVDFPFLLE
jgi:Ca2+-binding EF-hand superfamily protein